MSGVRLPETVLGLVADSGGTVAFAADHGAEVGESDVRFDVQLDDGFYSVGKVQRGVLERIVLTTSDIEILWRFLSITFGSELRSRAGWPLLRLSTGGDHLPAGCEIEKTGPRRFRLRCSSDGSTVEAADLIEVDAVDLAWTLGHSLDIVVDSFRHPAGLPAFPLEPGS